MSAGARVQLFPNQETRLTWEFNNCDVCVKRPLCDLEEAIASASVLDGTVSPEVANRLDFRPAWDPRTPWWCPEREVRQ